jgi:hypothetical protein
MPSFNTTALAYKYIVGSVEVGYFSWTVILSFHTNCLGNICASLSDSQKGGTLRQIGTSGFILQAKPGWRTLKGPGALRSCFTFGIILVIGKDTLL